MFNYGNGYSLSDIAAASGNRNGDGFCEGNGAWWIIILFLFCFMGGWGNNRNGWGGNDFGAGTNGALTRDAITYGFDMNGLSNQIANTHSAVTNSTEATNNGVRVLQNDLCGIGMTNLQNTNAITSAIANGTFSLSNQLQNMAAINAQCCCDNKMLVSSNFADLNYNLATQACQNRQVVSDSTRDIIDANNNNTRQILDFLVNDKISSLTAENASLKGQISQSEQNAYLLSKLSPSATPAYIVANPYTGNTYTTYGCGYGCGCNNN